MDLTKEQVRWINRMKRAIKDRPEGIGLFADEGGLHVVTLNDDGGFVFDNFGAVDINTYHDTIDSDCGSGSR